MRPDTGTRFVQLPSGLVVSEDAARRMIRPKAVDLFCGCGGFSLGMIQGGFEVVAACDNDPLATITYLINLGAYPMKIHCLTPEDEKRLDRAIWKHCAERHGDVLAMRVSGRARPADIPGVGHFFFGDIRRLTGRRILDALGMEAGDLDCV